MAKWLVKIYFSGEGRYEIEADTAQEADEKAFDLYSSGENGDGFEAVENTEITQLVERGGSLLGFLPFGKVGVPMS